MILFFRVRVAKATLIFIEFLFDNMLLKCKITMFSNFINILKGGFMAEENGNIFQIYWNKFIEAKLRKQLAVILALVAIVVLAPQIFDIVWSLMKLAYQVFWLIAVASIFGLVLYIYDLIADKNFMQRFVYKVKGFFKKLKTKFDEWLESD
jgi:hypothetical protein